MSQRKKTNIDIERLRKLEPIAALSEERLQELLPLTDVERIGLGGSLFREGDIDNQTIYLLQGDVHLSSSNISSPSPNTPRARNPLRKRKPAIRKRLPNPNRYRSPRPDNRLRRSRPGQRRAVRRLPSPWPWMHRPRRRPSSSRR